MEQATITGNSRIIQRCVVRLSDIDIPCLPDQVVNRPGIYPGPTRAMPCISIFSGRISLATTRAWDSWTATRVP